MTYIYILRVPEVLVVSQLSRHKCGYEHYKRQRNAQPRHLNGGVELVAGKESQITFHDYSLFSELTGFSVAALRLPTVTTADTITATILNASAKIHKLIGAL